MKSSCLIRSQRLTTTLCWAFLTGTTLFLSGQALAQLLQGSIDGYVTDQSQAVVAGSKVVATEQQTGLTRDTVTNSAGAYSLATLPPGTYLLTVTAPGFETYTKTGIIVEVNNVIRVNVMMTLGQTNERITVSADVWSCRPTGRMSTPILAARL